MHSVPQRHLAALTAWIGTCSRAWGGLPILLLVSNLAFADFDLDVDNDGQTEALTDGLLVIRHLFGFSGDTLTSGAVASDAQRTSSAEITTLLNASTSSLDIDGDGTTEALTDGLLIIRALFGFSGDSLISGAVSTTATRQSAHDIASYLQTITDTDNDGYVDSSDAFVNNASEWLDTDGDGTGNNADSDDDGDGIADSSDASPLDANNGSTANQAPVIASAATQSVTEGTFLVTTIAASDADNDTLTYTLSGTDAASFALSSSGELTFVSAPDYETKTSYQITVTVADATLNDSLDMMIAVTDQASEITITSAALKNTGSTYYNLPLHNTCYGASGGVSPLLSWSGAPVGTNYYAVTMHSVNSDGNDAANFTVFNIPAATTTLGIGDLSAGTIAAGDMTAAEITAAGGQAYAAPCASGAGTETLYHVTVYALSDQLALDATATRSTFKTAANEALLGSSVLTLRRVTYDAASIAKDAHVPTSVPVSCAEKTAHFNEYSVMFSAITCDTDANEMVVRSNWDSGLKTALTEQQIGVGTNSWIGRLALPSATGAAIRLQPSYLSGVNNNMACDGVDTLGLTVDGQPILPYYKQGGTATGLVCGPTDGLDYRGRDTVLTGEVDQCYGHSPNGEGYHLHGAPICLMDVHDPSKPVAYMVDGIPLYFGQGGGTLDTTDDASAVAYASPTNYGAGRYEHLDYRPTDVKDGTNPLNECNAYDLNGDGDVSGYVYYSTQEAPYSIGCFQGEKLADPSSAGGGTKLLSARGGFTGQTVGEAMAVSITSNVYATENDKTYNYTEFAIRDGATGPSFLTAGKTAQVLWRILDASDADYDASTTCFEFRYRTDKDVTDADETETICTEKAISAATLAFTPYGD